MDEALNSSSKKSSNLSETERKPFSPSNKWVSMEARIVASIEELKTRFDKELARYERLLVRVRERIEWEKYGRLPGGSSPGQAFVWHMFNDAEEVEQRIRSSAQQHI